MSEHHDVTDPQAPVPATITPAMVGEDLLFANEYGGWVNYEPQNDGAVVAKLYNEIGEIAKSFKVELIITEIN